MRNFKQSPWLRMLAFLVLPAVMIALFNQILIPTEEGIFYTFHELENRDDVELVIVGSSVVQTDFNPHIISQITDLETFSISAGHLSLPGALAATKAMYRSNTPEYVCLVAEPDTFAQTTENRQTQRLLLPHTMHPGIAVPYYLDLCSQDGMYFDRLLVFRSFMAQSLEDVRNAVAIRLNPQEYYVRSGLEENGYYRGRGHYRRMIEGNGEAMLRFTPLKPTQDVALAPGIKPYSVRKLLEYKALCEKHGSRLIVVMSPNMLANALAKDGYVQKHIEIAQLCAQHDIPFFNFYFAKESFIPRLDHYFEDILHMDYRGADIFSEKFALVLRDYLAGKETDHLFYQTAEEFLASIRLITNVWIDARRESGQDVYTADCLRGPCVVPEYSFYLLSADGTMTQLSPYSTDPVYACPSGSHAGKRLRVYARPAGSNEESIIFFDVECRE